MGQELPVSASAFRHTMGLFATGVTVLATPSSDLGWIGMTANAITSVSLDPVLLLVCVEKRANIASSILESPGFSLNVLGETQIDLSDFFAGRWRGEHDPEFHFEPWIGGPLLGGCVVTLGCARQNILEGGDHWIVLGRVDALHRPENPPAPLIFYASHYRGLAPLTE